MELFEQARRAMVMFQIEARGVKNPKVLAAMAAVPRHLFVSQLHQDEAYGDYPLPIGLNQTISQPYMVASMTELLDVSPGEKVLEIGTGCGYQTAVLAAIGAKVISIERLAELSEQAKANLEATGYTDPALLVGDGTLGHPQEAPYDRIMVTAGAPKVPQALLDQLKPGGRMVIPVGDRYIQELLLVKKLKAGVEIVHHGGCRFVHLLGQQGW